MAFRKAASEYPLNAIAYLKPAILNGAEKPVRVLRSREG
jgi:hypothetical protein